MEWCRFCREWWKSGAFAYSKTSRKDFACWTEGDLKCVCLLACLLACLLVACLLAGRLGFIMDTNQ